MSTLAEMQLRIGDDLSRTDLNSQIITAINRAIQSYAKRGRFWFNEKTATFSTVVGQLIYSSADGIPTDMMEIDEVQLALNATNIITLIPRTYDYIIRRSNNTSNGTPGDYAYYKQSFYIYPRPSQVNTITVSYAKSYPALAVGADTNDFLIYAEDLIEARAEWWLYSRILKDYDAAEISKKEESSHFEAIASETERITGTKKLQSSERRNANYWW